MYNIGFVFQADCSLFLPKNDFESFIYNQLMLLMAEILRKYPVEVGSWNLPWFTTGFIYIQKVAFSPGSFFTINGIYTGPKKN